MAQLSLDLGQRPALDREDFLVAPSNETAVAWIDRWPDWPGPGPHARSGQRAEEACTSAGSREHRERNGRMRKSAGEAGRTSANSWTHLPGCTRGGRSQASLKN